MVGAWIKLRGSLISSPKVIRMARFLASQPEFQEWLLPGYLLRKSCADGATSAQHVSDNALRAVALSCAAQAWSAAREYGFYEDEHLVLPGLVISDIDGMSCPRFGEAMELVGWAVQRETDVIFPNFKQHNIPATPAERMSQARYRRIYGQTESNRVAQSLRKPRNKSATKAPPQNSTEQNNISLSKERDARELEEQNIPAEIDTSTFRETWAEWLSYRKERRLKTTAATIRKQLAMLSAMGTAGAVESIEQSIRNGWQGLFDPKDNGVRTRGATPLEPFSQVAARLGLKDDPE